MLRETRALAKRERKQYTTQNIEGSLIFFSFGEDPAVAEAAGRLPMGARASLAHVVVQRRFVCGVGVLEVSGSVLETKKNQ